MNNLILSLKQFSKCPNFNISYGYHLLKINKVNNWDFYKSNNSTFQIYYNNKFKLYLKQWKDNETFDFTKETNNGGILFKVLDGKLLSYSQSNNSNIININYLHYDKNTVYTKNNIVYKLFSIGNSTTLHIEPVNKT